MEPPNNELILSEISQNSLLFSEFSIFIEPEKKIILFNSSDFLLLTSSFLWEAYNMINNIKQIYIGYFMS